MTSGTISFDDFQVVGTDAGPSWVGTKGYKTWDGGDKVVKKSKTPSPRAPVARFAKRNGEKVKAKPKPYKGKKAKPSSLSMPARVPNPAWVPPPRKPASNPGTELMEGPYKGRETLRWGEVNRHENAAPKRALGEFHDYDVTLVTQGQQIGSYRIIDNPNIPTYLGGMGTPVSFGATPVVSFLYSSGDELKLIGKLRERVAGSDFNAGVFMGESLKALDMIAKTATRLRLAYSYTRKGRLFDAARALGVSPQDRSLKTGRISAAERWLELQYGWLPLVKDIYGGAEFLAHHFNAPLQRRYRVRKRVYGEIHPSAAGYYLEKRALTDRQIIAIISEKDVAQLSGLQDPAEIAWELMPGSFLADWLIPIGSWLSARSLRSALKGLYIATTTERALAVGYMAPGVDLQYPGEYGYKYVRVERRVTDVLSVPFPEVKPLATVPSWKRAANAVALAVTAFYGNKRGLRDLTD